MNIDPLAPCYRVLEYCVFGRTLERRRFAFLHRLKHARRILILGEGDGRMLVKLLSAAPESLIDVVEISRKMIYLSQARIEEPNRVAFIQRDARLVQLPKSAYDAVVTCFFLDCFPEAEANSLVHKLAQALKPGGIWLMSDFELPVSGWRRWHAAIWTRAMYFFFRLTTGLRVNKLPPVTKLLVDAGMCLEAREEERAGMVVSELWRKSYAAAETPERKLAAPSRPM